MRIGFFGGSFDPPHRGHLAVAQAARKRCGLDRVVFAPTGRQPLKPKGPTASFADRLAMTQLLCASPAVPELEASAIDAPLSGGEPNYTVDTLERLRASLGDRDEIFSITGADAFLDLRRWRSPERLLQLAEWIVISRPGSKPEQLEQLGITAAQRARVHWVGDVCDPVSATEIRCRLAVGLDCEGLVPGQVLNYIAEHRLYTQPAS